LTEHLLCLEATAFRSLEKWKSLGASGSVAAHPLPGPLALGPRLCAPELLWGGRGGAVEGEGGTGGLWREHSPGQGAEEEPAWEACLSFLHPQQAAQDLLLWARPSPGAQDPQEAPGPGADQPGLGEAVKLGGSSPGHEAAFAAFLCCLCKIGVLRVDDQIAIVFKVFNRYLEVMRKLQKTYRMEPAGSQGVWGLDDFQFLPFIWGSSQLIDHPYLEPRHFVDEKAVNENHKDYMFLECILFITEMKTGPFAEHSNQLWNISAVPSWSKVNQGLIRMYKAECLEKFPVIQHFKFGSLLPIHPVTSS
uniref:Serine/threonine-protein phosphatase 2A activator n=1 Tax=Equus caballus TaxID=9796 RepID=A0A9L0RY81_HORSE